ncbi:mannose-1-phosphate guanylyltransferase [Qipengyuania aquimaris]|uniref:mannose-1-phosphate guanylyltransferase n=1 Tax=Qipengyuania aquimaris TaxID=255984 RepID=UPI001CD53FEA|nr:mannose-1-phosphate guanylyltransferase [Qipengyuania aquimaris]MCA0903020.1 mannose-1-phosphate guanylyltransferase [Qipengyuania aquimaris]
MSMIHPIILSGGSGTRLWPRSRRSYPKPFLPLLGDRTLFQQALDRVSDTASFAQPMIVAGEAHTRFITEQAGQHRLVVEPAAKNTAPAIALAASLLPREAIMLVCPSDHHIADEAAFLAGAKKAASLAADGNLVSFGIAPDRPATGYGYIKLGNALGDGHRIERFVEKPDLDRAREFLASGDYVWNGGIFAFQAGTFLDELAKHRPEMAKAVAASVEGGSWTDGRFDPDAGHFGAIAGESVDYAVMENTAQAAVVAADMGWSDIGDWNALFEARAAQGGGENVVSGPAEVKSAKSVMIDTDGPRVSLVGFDNAIVVVDGDEILVLNRDHAQEVGKLDGAANQ